ncbi:MAG TPA: hypothetical protein VMB79_01715 [Jatrophihabitans sp.]|nr:hypothetical protein [Jatrophihabitans sp.]
MTIADSAPKDPELVFATVRPVGTPDERLMTALRGTLLGYGYASHDIKLSTILMDHALENGRPIPTEPEHERIHLLMDEGDALCAERHDPAAVLQDGIRQLRGIRSRILGDGAPLDEADRAAEAVPRAAYIIDSLKRPAEVQQLREICGDRLLVLSLQSSLSTRKAELSGLIKPHLSGSEHAASIATLLSTIATRLSAQCWNPSSKMEKMSTQHNSWGRNERRRNRGPGAHRRTCAVNGDRSPALGADVRPQASDPHRELPPRQR